MKEKKLVIVGDSAFAEVAYEYFEQDSSYRVVAFAVEAAYKKRDMLFGLPVVEFERIEEFYPPTNHDVFVAIVYTQMNRLRTRLLSLARAKGYVATNYVSSNAFVWNNVSIGENCFIFEDNTIQPFVTIGDNVILWSGNHIGHHSVIEDNVFISSHVVISGFCRVGKNSFLGVNGTVANNITLGKDNWIGPGVVISKNTGDAELYGPPESSPSRVSSLRFFKVKE